jgi:hypothetical protein
VQALKGKDGIDPDVAKAMTIEDCRVLAKDDAIVVKTRTAAANTERAIVRRRIVASGASALKIGTGTRALFRDVRLEVCDRIRPRSGCREICSRRWPVRKRELASQPFLARSLVFVRPTSFVSKCEPSPPGSGYTHHSIIPPIPRALRTNQPLRQEGVGIFHDCSLAQSSQPQLWKMRKVWG